MQWSSRETAEAHNPLQDYGTRCCLCEKVRRQVKLRMLAALARLFTWNFQMEHSGTFPNVPGASGCFGMFFTLPADAMLMDAGAMRQRGAAAMDHAWACSKAPPQLHSR